MQTTAAAATTAWSLVAVIGGFGIGWWVFQERPGEPDAAERVSHTAPARAGAGAAPPQAAAGQGDWRPRSIGGTTESWVDRWRAGGGRRSRGASGAAALVGAFREMDATEHYGIAVRIVQDLARLSPDETAALLRELQELPVTDGMGHEIAGEVLVAALELAGRPAEGLDAGLAAGVPSYELGQTIHRWALVDPDAALTWLMETRAAGELVPRGTDDDDLLQTLSGALASGLAAEAPETAIDVVALVPGSRREEAIARLAQNVSVAAEGDLDPALTRRLSEAAAAQGFAPPVMRHLSDVAAGWGRLDSVDALLAGSGHHLSEDETSELVFSASVSAGYRLGISEAGDWLLGHAGGADRAEAVRRFAGELRSNATDLVTWSEQLDDPALQDLVLSEAATGFAESHDDFGQAGETAARLTDPVLREAVLLQIEALAEKDAAQNPRRK